MGLCHLKTYLWLVNLTNYAGLVQAESVCIVSIQILCFVFFFWTYRKKLSLNLPSLPSILSRKCMRTTLDLDITLFFTVYWWVLVRFSYLCEHCLAVIPRFVWVSRNILRIRCVWGFNEFCKVCITFSLSYLTCNIRTA